MFFFAFVEFFLILQSIPSGNVKIGIVKPKPQFKDQFFNEDIEEEDEELEEENVEGTL